MPARWLSLNLFNAMNYTIDATGKKLGRLASEIAIILMGKNDASFERNKVSTNKVVVLNASKLAVDLKKLKTKEYERYSGYPGGLTKEMMENVIARKGYKDVLKWAVYGMLPINKLRARVIKNLTVEE
jgi:large subunit ribosomal protein L13